MVLDSRVCNSTNTLAVDQSSFWSNGSVNWDAHRIGWVVAGSFAVATVLVTAFSVTMHTLYYNSKMQQRQIIVRYIPLGIDPGALPLSGGAGAPIVLLLADDLSRSSAFC